MKLTHEVDMKTENHSSTIVASPELTEKASAVTSAGGRISRNRKCIIIAVATIVTLTVVGIATLIGVKFYLDSKVQTEQIRMQYGSVTVDESSLPDESELNQVMRYHVEDKKNDIIMWVITDMRRGIQVMKTLRGDSKMCTVTPLDIISKSPSSGQPISSMSLNSTDTKENTIAYILSEWPILDTSILGYYGDKLCQGIDVYWAYPSCPISNSQINEENQPSGKSGEDISRIRRKRAGTCYYSKCTYNTGNCYYTTYANDGRKYYTCSCTYQYYPYSC